MTSDIDKLLHHLTEPPFSWRVTRAPGPQVPYAWELERELNGGWHHAGVVYALPSGRILALPSGFDATLTVDIFGAEWRTLAEICDNQAPVPGRIVHVISKISATTQVAPAIIESVADDGSCCLWVPKHGALPPDKGHFKTLLVWVPYGWSTPRTDPDATFWVWPRIVR